MMYKTCFHLANQSGFSHARDSFSKKACCTPHSEEELSEELETRHSNKSGVPAQDTRLGQLERNAQGKLDACLKPTFFALPP